MGGVDWNSLATEKTTGIRRASIQHCLDIVILNGAVSSKHVTHVGRFSAMLWSAFSMYSYTNSSPHVLPGHGHKHEVILITCSLLELPCQTAVNGAGLLSRTVWPFQAHDVDSLLLRTCCVRRPVALVVSPSSHIHFLHLCAYHYMNTTNPSPLPICTGYEYSRSGNSNRNFFELRLAIIPPSLRCRTRLRLCLRLRLQHNLNLSRPLPLRS